MDTGEAERHGWRAETRYVDGISGPRAGYRLTHTISGFTLDLLLVQSAPQGLLWVNTLPVSDKGEPHTLEHLLIGKGTKGARLSALETTLMVDSSAFTENTRTVYHFRCLTPEILLHYLEVKLDALLHPNFTADEVAREVCHVGIAADCDNQLSLEEKGTVYNEMLSAFDRPNQLLFRELYTILYGEGHPLAFVAGGVPDDIRHLTSDEIYAYHSRWYHLHNMGLVLCVSEGIPLGELLEQLSALLLRLGPDPHGSPPAAPSTLLDWKGVPAPVQTDTPELVTVPYPHSNTAEPSLLVLAWLTNREGALDALSSCLLGAFINCFASGSTSTLHFLTIEDGAHRVFDAKASSVSAWEEDHRKGHPAFISFNDAQPCGLTNERITELIALIHQAMREVCGEDPEKAEEFHNHAAAWLRKQRRSWRMWRESPPGFGERGLGESVLVTLNYFNHFTFPSSLGAQDGIDILNEEVLDEALRLLRVARENREVEFWLPWVERWGLLSRPAAVAALPDTAMASKMESEKSARLASVVKELQPRFSVAEESAALQLYKEEYDRVSARIKQSQTIPVEASQSPQPAVEPPLLQDDKLKFFIPTNWEDLTPARPYLDLCTASNGMTGEALPPPPLVVCHFPGRSSLSLGLYYDLRRAVSHETLIYLGCFTSLLRSAGCFTEDGRSISLKQMDELRSHELVSASASLSVSATYQRAELQLFIKAADITEFKLHALKWLHRMCNPYWAPENLAALQSIVQNKLHSLIGTMKERDEYWVDNPINGLLHQTDPIYLETSNHFAMIFSCYRLRWRLRTLADALHETWQQLVSSLLAAATTADDGLELLRAVPAKESNTRAGVPATILDLLQAKPEVQPLFEEFVADLVQLLSTAGQIDDGLARFRADVTFLAATFSADLLYPAAEVLKHLQSLLRTVTSSPPTRAYLAMGADCSVVNDSGEPESLTTGVIRLVRQFVLSGPQRHVAGEHSPAQSDTPPNFPRVLQNLNARREVPVTWPLKDVHVAYISPQMTQGVISRHVPFSGLQHGTADSVLIPFLLLKAFTGAAEHSLFMRTWQEGLAYSSGISVGSTSGFCRYYADHCPSLAKTASFCTEALTTELFKWESLTEAEWQAKLGELADHAVAEECGGTRVGDEYDSRTQSFAWDLTIGLYPCRVAAFRRALIGLRDRIRAGDVPLRPQDFRAQLALLFPDLVPTTPVMEPSSVVRSLAGPVHFSLGPPKLISEYEVAGLPVVPIYQGDFWLR
eukprot:TRINITY_DN15786_c0_g1_i1.p1 TRINITY_DN15786_c0_g1~~TRINITY_DN15786_c0_g1_i1.p1  ORF type:complete len:1249 (-),score=173.48 TRINITY_DN15786_c0_g1_i1:6-3752(-)